ncbi:MAG: hypothetical protein HGB04_09635 [Chlorobiaceae bacterium]|nr:hypothetical protein [Chlorobiaceae bacterium]
MFALFANINQATLNPFDVSWVFYVVPAGWLDARTRSQYSITVPSLRAAFAAVAYADLAESVTLAGAEHRRMKNEDEGIS